MSKEALQRVINAARTELDAIEDAEQALKLAALVGKCFKYRNSYGGLTEAERWWMYVVVVGVEGRFLNCKEFETDCNGRIQIGARSMRRMSMSDGYKPITRAEFDRAWRKTLKAATDYAP